MNSGRLDMIKWMTRFFLVVLILSCPLIVRGQNQPVFTEYFTDQALRVDLYQVGDAKDEVVTIDHIYQEEIWPESRAHLIDPFGYGRYAVKLYDVASNQLIYARGFDSMFGEYKTTTPALNGVKRVFKSSVRIPYPKRPFLFVIEMRDKKQL